MKNDKNTCGNSDAINSIIEEDPQSGQLDKFERNKNKIQNLLQKAKVNKKSIEDTILLYMKMAKDKNMQGMNFKQIILGIYYYVCYKSNMGRTIKEISDMFGVTERKIKRAFKSIKKDIVEPSVEENEMLNIEES